MKPGALLGGLVIAGVAVFVFMAVSSAYIGSTGGVPAFAGLGQAALHIMDHLGPAAGSDRLVVLQGALGASALGIVGGGIMVVAQLLPVGAEKGKKKGRGKGEARSAHGHGDAAEGGKRKQGGKGKRAKPSHPDGVAVAWK